MLFLTVLSCFCTGPDPYSAGLYGAGGYATHENVPIDFADIHPSSGATPSTAGTHHDEAMAVIPGDEITQIDSWQVIQAFFDHHGLCHQQLDSFNDFVTYKMQELVDEHPPIEIRPESQYRPEDEIDATIMYRLKFGQLSLNRPSTEDAEGESRHLWPTEARLRNLT